MESQLQDVLRLWENSADEARGDSAKECADLRKQVETLQASLSAAEANARRTEATLRDEMEQIMKLWDEAQGASAQEVEQLQDRIVELKHIIERERAANRRREVQDDAYF